MNEGRSEESVDKIKKGLRETAEGVKKGVEDTAEGVKKGVEDTAEGVKDTAQKTSDEETYTKSYQQNANREYNKAGSNGKTEDIIRKSAENVRQKASKIADKGRSSKIVKTTGVGPRTVLRRPLVIVLIIAAIATVVVLLSTQTYLSNQSEKIENYSALWNQSLADLRSGNTTVGEYCINRVHDEDFCNRLKNLEYMN